jgi:DUF4097 and DUF4098 domain-containing protein YvlB
MNYLLYTQEVQKSNKISKEGRERGKYINVDFKNFIYK